MTDVSVIVNLHGEGRIAVAALRSAAAAIAAAPGLACEIVAVVDRGDEATERAIRRFEGAPRRVACDFGDPALARNFGVERAKGKFVAFLDGDDLMSESWLRRAAEALGAREDAIAHPRLNYVFGRDVAPIVWVHPDMERDAIDLSLIRAGNFWTSASFAPTAVHRRFPFRANALQAGLGHEDWAFNLMTVEAGLTHIAPEETVHFIRRQEAAGRLAQSQAQRLLPNFAFTRGSPETTP